MSATDDASAAAPQQLISVRDGIALIVGMVIGAGIFKAPSIVAGNTASGTEFLLAWVFGGIASPDGPRAPSGFHTLRSDDNRNTSVL